MQLHESRRFQLNLGHALIKAGRFNRPELTTSRTWPLTRAFFCATTRPLTTKGSASVAVNVSPGWLFSVLMELTNRTATMPRVWEVAAPAGVRKRTSAAKG